MAASLAGLSASVTRILALTGFPKELKTKDIQAAFSDWDSVNGGYKIKWKDDTSLWIVFQDASVAKRAYLHTLAYPPSVLTSADGVPATIRPYDGPEAQAVIQSVNNRGQHNSTASRHNNRAASISVFPTRSQNGSIPNNPSFRPNNGQNVGSEQVANGGAREGSPTLPSLPSHPTLNSLISSSLGDVTAPPNDPAILSSSADNFAQGGPRIGDPGKRMLGAALGVRHPALGPRSVGGPNGSPVGLDMHHPMGGLVGVAE